MNSIWPALRRIGHICLFCKNLHIAIKRSEKWWGCSISHMTVVVRRAWKYTKLCGLTYSFNCCLWDVTWRAKCRNSVTKRFHKVRRSFLVSESRDYDREWKVTFRCFILKRTIVKLDRIRMTKKCKWALSLEVDFPFKNVESSLGQHNGLLVSYKPSFPEPKHQINNKVWNRRPLWNSKNKLRSYSTQPTVKPRQDSSK